MLTICFVGMAAAAELLAPYGPHDRDQQTVAPSGPSPQHWLGVDADQKDVLSRVIYGSRLSLMAGGLSILLAVALGVPAGLLAGYFGGWVDSLLMRGVDVALAFPSILIALLVVAAYRPGYASVVLAVGLINVPIFVRQVRISVLALREQEFVLAARALGASPARILHSAILPGIVSPVVVLATMGLGTAILEVAGLSFLGIGGDPTTPEWGSMLAQAKDHLTRSFWPALAPGIAISTAILAFNLLGDALRDALDPRL